MSRSAVWTALWSMSLGAVMLTGCSPEPTTGQPLALPWASGQTQHATLGPRRSSHQAGPGRWAWDFDLRAGQWVHSPVRGVVRLVRDDSTRGGCSPKLADEANYVVISREQDEVLLLHLEAGSAQVRAGQRVEPGQRVARVGRTGWTCGDHLHVQRQQPCPGWWCPSLPIRWEVGPIQVGQALRAD